MIDCEDIFGEAKDLTGGWKMIIILSNNIAKRLEKHYQVTILWLNFFSSAVVTTLYGYVSQECGSEQCMV